MFDEETERRIKMMTQDYEWQTRGIPQRLDHVLYDGFNKGLADAARNQAKFDAETEYVVETTRKNIRNATYEQLKQNYFDYTEEYNRAVRGNRIRLSVFKFFMYLFGLGSLGSIGLSIGSCFFDSASDVPELMKPFYDGGGVFGMILFFVLGVIWLVMYMIWVGAGDPNPECSGMAGRYLDILEVIERKLKSKKFSKRYKADPDFFELEEDEDEDDEEEEELYEDEEGNYYADDDPENPKNKKKETKKTDNRTAEEKYGFEDGDEDLDKAIKIKRYCEENGSLFSTALLQRVLHIGYSAAGRLKESVENIEEED